MSDATAARRTPQRTGRNISLPMTAATVLYAGTMIGVISGRAVNAGDGVAAIGVAKETVDNSAGAADALNIEIATGVFRMANSGGGDVISRSDIGYVCYAADNQTVALTDNTGDFLEAGVVVDVDSAGVWVDVGAAGRIIVSGG